MANHARLATGKRVNNMASAQLEISKVLGDLHEMAPAGYAIGLHINYTTPKFMFQTYDKAWLSYYSQNGLLMKDPTLTWGFENVGAIRWDALRDKDSDGILNLAADFGIRFGITCAKESSDISSGVRSIGSFARADRDFTDDEVTRISKGFDLLNDETEDQARLPEETVRILKKMSVMVTHPGS